MGSENNFAGSEDEVSLGEDTEGKLELLNITPEDFVSLTSEEKEITIRYANALWKIQQKSASGEDHPFFERALSDPEVALCLAYGRRIHFEQIHQIRLPSGDWSKEDSERLKKLYDEESEVLRNRFPGEMDKYFHLSNRLDRFLRDAA